MDILLGNATRHLVSVKQEKDSWMSEEENVKIEFLAVNLVLFGIASKYISNIGRRRSRDLLGI